MKTKVLKCLSSLAIAIAFCTALVLPAKAAAPIPATPTGLRITNTYVYGSETRGFYFDWNERATSDNRFYLYIGKTADFTDDYLTYSSYSTESTRLFSYANSGYLKPGETYYAKLKQYESGYYTAEDGYVRDYWEYSGYSAPISFKVPAPSMSSLYATINSNNIRLNMSADGVYTGFQVWRKAEGGSFQRLGNISTDTLLDSGLSGNTKYTYKVRPYYYNETTKKTIYGEYLLRDFVTNGSALNLKCDIKGKTVKLSWNKVKGAKGYKIYRTAYSSDGDTYKDGTWNSYTNFELIKTIKKGNTKTFTDKKVKANQHYTYKVVANTTLGKTESEISETASATMKFSTPSITIQKYNTNGSKYIKWNNVYGVAGYIIEKRNDKGDYVTVQTLSKSTTSFTLPAPALGATDNYRLRAYKGSNYSDYSSFSVDSYLPVIQQVSAKATSTGIHVSWTPVAGATYYNVLRSTSTSNDYNADNGYRPSSGGSYVYQFKKITKDTETGYYDLSGWESQIKTTSIDDDYYRTGKEEYEYEGPTPGQTYTYYVIAHAAKEETSKYGYTSYTTLARSLGCKKVATATYTNITLPGTPKITLKSSKKGQATITVKSKVNSATGYIIYRSTKQKSGYEIVGTTSKSTFTDKKLKSGKKYYYKVRAYRGNELNADVYSAYSKVGNVKAK